MIWIKQGVTGDWINCLINSPRLAPVAFSFNMEILQLDYSIQHTIKRTSHLWQIYFLDTCIRQVILMERWTFS